MSDDKRIIINSPYEEPREHWNLNTGDYESGPTDISVGRRRAEYFYHKPGGGDVDELLELELVNRIRPKVKEWVADALKGRGGVSGVTMDLLKYWRREGREHPLFFAQLEAAETIIFLTEARSDLLQGLNIPPDAVSPRACAAGARPFKRLCCKMATGTGKTTVMGMLAAWSILNKVDYPNDKRYSDAVLVVCPNVTIRDRLGELDPRRGDASIYRTRDLAPKSAMPLLNKGRVLVTNWHVFEPQQPGGALVVKTGDKRVIEEEVHIGSKSKRQYGKRYMTEADLFRRRDMNKLKIVKVINDETGRPIRALINEEKYVESDRALVRRALEKTLGAKKNILVFNDEAHHAYRLPDDDSDLVDIEDLELNSDKPDAEALRREATVWVDGLDKVHSQRGVNRCVDFSATPHFFGVGGEKQNRIFPWVVSDFGLADAIESGLVKVPQFPLRDSLGGNSYYDLWGWILRQVKDRDKKSIKPEEALKHAQRAIGLVVDDWDKLRREWEDDQDEERSPALIIVCKNVALAKMVYDYIAEDKRPPGVAPLNNSSLRNRNGEQNTLRIDSKVARDMQSDQTQTDETRWMRFTLDTIGKTEWPVDSQSRPIYPPGFKALAEKLNRAETPPGRDVRCVVSVSMLTEGWDCKTVTHIIGLRPFGAQLLCEQVVGRGLRRANYEAQEDGNFSEEHATIFGVPFKLIPYKVAPGEKVKPKKRYRITADPQKAEHKIVFPRVERYRHEVNAKIKVDFSHIPPLDLNVRYQPEATEVKETPDPAMGPYARGGAGRLIAREARRLQMHQFKVAHEIATQYGDDKRCDIPIQSLFWQVLAIVKRYCDEKVSPQEKILDAFEGEHYSKMVRGLVDAIVPDVSGGKHSELPCYERDRNPGSTAEVDFFTSVEPVTAEKTHLTAVACDNRLEREVAFALDHNSGVKSFVKNKGLNFNIRYLSEDEHEYVPDYIVRLTNSVNLILEPKAQWDMNKEAKATGAQRWVDAVNADGRYGKWHYETIQTASEVNPLISKLVNGVKAG